MVERRRRKSRPASPPEPVADSPSGGEPIAIDTGDAGIPVYRRRKKSAAGPLLIGAILLGGLGVGGWLFYPREEPQSGPTLSISDKQTDELATLHFGLKAAGLQFTLLDGPEGAALDPRTGEFTWTPSEAQGPETYQITVQADDDDGATAQTTFTVTVNEVNEPPVVSPIDDLTIDGKSPVRVAVEATDADLPRQSLIYSLVGESPSGAAIDEQTGVVTWDPASAKPGSHLFEVRVAEAGPNGLEATGRFLVTIERPPGPAEQFVDDLRSDGVTVQFAATGAPSSFAGARDVLQIEGERVALIEYDSSEAAAGDRAEISPDGSTLFGEPQSWKAPAHFYHRDRLLALYEGDHPQVLGALAKRLGEPFLRAEPTPERAPTIVTPEDVVQLVELYNRRKKLFAPREYKTLRKIFADRFEQRYEDELRRAFGDEYGAMMDWFGERVDLKEELFTSIDPKFDNVVAALGLFHQLKTTFPESIGDYGELAIAVAVTWDNDRRGVYDYAHHQRRTKTTLPEDLLDAMDSFRYLTDAEKIMQGRPQFLPWEFLVHLVNHETPQSERLWAVQNYLPKRVMFGQCYSDVPYDEEMLATQSAVANLNGREYTLPNLRQYGGVCAMQADFAARVGKSIGVPAEYVSGESTYGDLHAWVMWVELKQVTRSSIVFSLESHGRYRGDKYYVGTLTDPHTGERITDRQLELALQTVGLNPQAKRQADLIMRAYPLIRDEAELDATAQIVFLDNVIDLCPGNTDAWRELARISREGDVRNQSYKLMSGALDKLFRTFARFPDFTWTVFDDLIAYQNDANKRLGLYARLVALYEAAGRPDLACEARLKLADYLVAEGRPGDAVQGLALTVKKFPEEGRYVPRLLDALERICRDQDVAPELLVRFYQEFLPLIPQKRGDAPSKYCMSMYERAIDLFAENNQPQLAQALSIELEKIRSGR